MIYIHRKHGSAATYLHLFVYFPICVCLFVFVYFPECIFPKCIFTKCTRLTHLLALRVYFYRRASLRWQRNNKDKLCLIKVAYWYVVPPSVHCTLCTVLCMGQALVLSDVRGLAHRQYVRILDKAPTCCFFWRLKVELRRIYNLPPFVAK